MITYTDRQLEPVPGGPSRDIEWQKALTWIKKGRKVSKLSEEWLKSHNFKEVGGVYEHEHRKLSFKVTEEGEVTAILAGLKYRFKDLETGKRFLEKESFGIA